VRGSADPSRWVCPGLGRDNYSGRKSHRFLWRLGVSWNSRLAAGRFVGGLTSEPAFRSRAAAIASWRWFSYSGGPKFSPRRGCVPWLDYAAPIPLALGPAWKEALLISHRTVAVVSSSSALGAVELPITLRWALRGSRIGSVVVQKVPSDVGLFALRITFEPISILCGFLLPRANVDQMDSHRLPASSLALALHGLYQY